MNSKSFKISLCSEQLTEDLKNKVQELTGIDPKRQILFCKGKEISSKKAVNLTQHAIIHIKQA
jgi:hypothetical protein